MNHFWHSPLLVFPVCLAAFWLAAQVGFLCRVWLHPPDEARDDFDVVLTATLTLLGLIIGFSFSMAISRYDQRKNYEEAEANAIGTEYLRAELLPGPDTVKIRGLLKQYLQQRVQFYTTLDAHGLELINAATSALQNDLWEAVRGPAQAQPNALSGLAVAGMNDVLNSQGYSQAAWWNRIPTAAWQLMAAIALCCNLMIGYRAHRRGALLFLIVPLAVSISFFLIADIDSPRGGLIHVAPQNLLSLEQALR
jgi:hypothetical protein